MNLVVLVYEVTRDFLKYEIYGLSSQIRRSAVSILSNISEGRRRGSHKEFQRFLRFAFGSAAELETQLEIVSRLQYGDKNKLKEAQNLLEEILKMLNKMTQPTPSTSTSLLPSSLPLYL